MNAVPRPCPERELLLHGLADGELDAANALAMEQHLQNCSACAAAYRDILRHKQILKSESLRFGAPVAFRDRMRAAIAEEAPTARHSEGKAPIALVRPSRARPATIGRAGAIISAMALAASLILFVNVMSFKPGLDNELVAAHVRSLLVTHLTDVASTDRHTVKPWFLGKLDFGPPVADPDPKDYPLIGGRLDYLHGRVVAALIYKRGGHVINLFVWPSSEQLSGVTELEGYNIVRWTERGFFYAAVSDLNLKDLRGFQRALENSVP